MAELPNREEKDELDELLTQYEQLREGGAQSFLEERKCLKRL
jgi:hypothetical protein